MTKVIAHRGARSLAPENTLIAAKIARDLGADMWETDISLTKDARLVLYHDQSLNRCTDVKKKFPNRETTLLKDYTLEQILSLDAGSYFERTDPFLQISEGRIDPKTISSFKNQRIPTLEQGLKLVQDMDWTINLELKCHTPDHDRDKSGFIIPDDTVRTVQNCGISMDRVIISSFNHDWLLRVGQIEPRLELAALVGENNTKPLDFGDFSFPTYNVNAALVTKEQIQTLRAKGKTVNLFTVNDPETFARFSVMGVDGIFTDFPQLFCSDRN